ncbi:MAG: CotH kinase family protein, partial [Balneolaceae bacterium]
MSKYFSITSCLILIFFSISAFGQSNTLVINEFLADNSTILQDEDGSYSDWIEIYNSGDEVVNLNGFSVTDDPSELEQWIFPDINIDSQEYLLIFASGENRIATDSELHTNFSLNKSGEFIGLFDQSGVVIDSVSFGEQNTDYSYGRIPDDISKWLFFPEPTPAAANSTNGILFSEAPKFSLSGGFYESTQQLTLSVKNNESNVINIYYTLDGTPPDHNSAKYLDPIAITNTTPVRAITIEEGKEVSHVITHTYFIDEVINLPFISLVTHPDNFFSDETGIYVTGTNGAPGSCQRDVLRNLNQDWERPVNIELFEMDGTTGLNQGAGVKIFGGCSRTRYPQKSLALFARSQYGTGDFDYQLFENKEIDSFEAFILRSSADDQVYTMFRDAFTQYSQLGFMDIDYQAYRPVVVFINGEYWGIHNLREKINEHYLADNHGVDPDAVHILENNAQVVQGSASHYNRLVDFVSSSDMNEPNRYSYVTTQMDIAQYIDYQIANIYLAENDWPGNNIKFWRADDETAKWRWLTFDKDQSYQDYQL